MYFQHKECHSYYLKLKYVVLKPPNSLNLVESREPKVLNYFSKLITYVNRPQRHQTKEEHQIDSKIHLFSAT